MKRFVLSIFAAALMLSAGPALSQANSTTFTIPAVKHTYSATAVALSPAASATDFFTLTGSATKVIRITGAQCNGVSTAEASHVIVAVKRSGANLTGTSSNLVEVPHDSTLSAATATALSYTANPGTLGTLVGNLDAKLITTSEAAAGVTVPSGAEFTFGSGRQNYPVTLRGITQVFGLNGAATSFAAGTSLNCSITWIEE